MPLLRQYLKFGTLVSLCVGVSQSLLSCCSRTLLCISLSTLTLPMGCLVLRRGFCNTRAWEREFNSIQLQPVNRTALLLYTHR